MGRGLSQEVEVGRFQLNSRWLVYPDSPSPMPASRVGGKARKSVGACLGQVVTEAPLQ